MYKSKVFDNGTFCDYSVFLKEFSKLRFRAFFHIGNVKLGRGLIFPSAGLYVDGSPVKSVEMKLADCLVGHFSILHVDKGKVFILGALRHRAIWGEERFNLFLGRVL